MPRSGDAQVSALATRWLVPVARARAQQRHARLQHQRTLTPPPVVAIPPPPCSIRDDAVPLESVQRLADELQCSSRAFRLELLPDGNHRLSREADLQLMCRLLGDLARAALQEDGAG